MALLEQKFLLLIVNSVTSGVGIPRVALMTTLQAIGFGAMLAWTPSLIVLAWLLRDIPLDELDEF
jgi:hypothetical protein